MVQWKWPRLINIAVGLTVAAVAALLASFQLSPLIGERDTLGVPKWEVIVWGLGSLLPLAALGAWALTVLAAVIRWNADFEGF